MNPMEAWVFVWEALQTAGSGLSVLFILAIAGVLAILAVVYAVAAVIVLARFARASEQLPSAGAAALLWSAGGAALALRLASPEWAEAAWRPWFSAWGWEWARVYTCGFNHHRRISSI